MTFFAGNKSFIRRWFTAVSCGCALLLSAPLSGSGFLLQEQSSTAQGNAFAGATAGAEDPSYMFFNPAAITRQCGTCASTGIAYIRPSAKFKDGVATTANATAITGLAATDGFADDAFLPTFAVTHELCNSWWVGLTVNSPFGLVTEYDEQWVGRYHGLKSELLSINLGPTVGWKPCDWLGVALTFNAQYVDVELTSAVDFGTISLAGPAAFDGSAVIEGDDWGFGGTIGVLIEPNDCLRMGFSYRTQIRHNVKGTVDWTIPAPLVGALGGTFVDGGASASVKLPGRYHAGIYYDINDCWSVMGEFQWTEWHKFKELRVKFDSAVPDNVTEEEWDDSFFVAGGLTWRPNCCWALRTGVAYDESPVPDEYRTPRIPDSDRLWWSVGANYTPWDCVSFDLSYTHIWVDDATLSLTTNGADTNASRGNLAGRYESSIDIVTLSAGICF